MQRLEVFHLTGMIARNEKVARRLNKKIRSLLLLSQTVLLDFEGVKVVEPTFFTILLNLPNLDQIKVCGLPAEIRAELLASKISGAVETLIP